MITVEHVTKRYGPHTAVDDVSFVAEPGRVTGFLGPNGAGKSTTVHMLTTLLPPTSGTARVGGHDIVREGPEVRAVIGAALQEAALDPFLTGAEHLRLQTALHGIRGAEAKRRWGELLARVGAARQALAAGRRREADAELSVALPGLARIGAGRWLREGEALLATPGGPASSRSP